MASLSPAAIAGAPTAAPAAAAAAAAGPAAAATSMLPPGLDRKYFSFWSLWAQVAAAAAILATAPRAPPSVVLAVVVGGILLPFVGEFASAYFKPHLHDPVRCERFLPVSLWWHVVPLCATAALAAFAGRGRLSRRSSRADVAMAVAWLVGLVALYLLVPHDGHVLKAKLTAVYGPIRNFEAMAGMWLAGSAGLALLLHSVI